MAKADVLMQPSVGGVNWGAVEGKLKSASPLIHEHVKAIRPWVDFFAFQRMKRPTGFNGAKARVEHNLTYYYANYAVISLILLVYTLFTSIALLFSLAFILGVGYFLSTKTASAGANFNATGSSEIQLFGGKFKIEGRIAYAIYIVLSLVLLYFSSAGSILFWLLGICALMVGLHAAFLDVGIEAEFIHSGGHRHV